MTKKLAITYSMLFLFVFTFAFAFAMEAKAGGGVPCCVYEWCYATNPPYMSAQGHLVEFTKPEVHTECVFDGSDTTCDFAWICSEEGPPGGY